MRKFASKKGSHLVLKDNGNYLLKLSKSEWLCIGNMAGWTKTAMPVIRPSPESASKMREENVRFWYDINRLLPNTKIKELKALLADIGGMDGISLPKVSFPTPNNIVTYEGREYYYLNHDKKEDKLWLLAIDTDDVVELPYEATLPSLNLTDSDRREVVRQQVNKAIKEWNLKIDKFDRTVGLVTIPLRIQRVLKLIDSRTSELQGQKSAFEKQKSHPGFGSEGLSQYKQESIDALTSGKLLNDDRTAIDTALFWYQEKPENLLSDLPSFQISQSASKSLSNIATQEIKNREQEYAKKQQKWDEREQRIEEELPEIREPSLEPVSEFEAGQLPGGSANKMQNYRSPDAYFKQKHSVLKEIDFQLKTLTDIRSSLMNIVGKIGGTEKGQLSHNFLVTPEGKEIVSDLKGFLQTAYGFVKKYEVEIFTETGQVNPLLFSRKGEMGNVELAVEMNRLYNAVRKGLQDIPGYMVQPPINIQPAKEEVISESKSGSLLIKIASDMKIKLSEKEWTTIGQKAGWLKIN